MSATQVILLERIEALGQMGDVVRVKPGYARNFLLPQKKAMRATKENLAVFERQLSQLVAQNLERKSEAEAVAARMVDLTVVVIRQAGETGQLYGSVSNRDIGDAVTAAGFTVDRRQVLLQNPIKALGIHPIRVALHPEVSVEVRVNVAQSADEAKVQAEARKAPAAEAAAPVAEAAPAETAPEAAAAEDSAEAPAAAKKAKKAKAAKTDDAEA
jgi:large subunit ribosomal protein L9